MAGWFELSQSTDGQFRFILKAGNGETILTSELYQAKNSAENGIASIQSNSGSAERYDEKISAKCMPQAPPVIRVSLRSKRMAKRIW
jgi:uncharacterized protein